MEKPEERNQMEQMKRRIRALEQALVDRNIDSSVFICGTSLIVLHAGRFVD